MQCSTRCYIAAALTVLASGVVTVRGVHAADHSFSNITQSAGASGPTAGEDNPVRSRPPYVGVWGIWGAENLNAAETCLTLAIPNAS